MLNTKSICTGLLLLGCAMMPAFGQYEDEYADEQESQQPATQAVGAPVSDDTESIARCMADRGVVMYGSAECGHTKRQISMFDGYFGYIPFVDCRRNRRECREVGVGPYPHWVFPSGEYIGGQELEPAELAVYAGCQPTQPMDTTIQTPPPAATPTKPPSKKAPSQRKLIAPPKKAEIQPDVEADMSGDAGFQNFRGY